MDESLPGEEVVDPPGLVHVNSGEAARLAQPQSSPLFTLLAYTTQELGEEYRTFLLSSALGLHGPNNEEIPILNVGFS